MFDKDAQVNQIHNSPKQENGNQEKGKDGTVLAFLDLITILTIVSKDDGTSRSSLSR